MALFSHSRTVTNTAFTHRTPLQPSISTPFFLGSLLPFLPFGFLLWRVTCWDWPGPPVSQWLGSHPAEPGGFISGFITEDNVFPFCSTHWLWRPWSPNSRLVIDRPAFCRPVADSHSCCEIMIALVVSCRRQHLPTFFWHSHSFCSPSTTFPESQREWSNRPL